MSIENHSQLGRIDALDIRAAAYPVSIEGADRVEISATGLAETAISGQLHDQRVSFSDDRSSFARMFDARISPFLSAVSSHPLPCNGPDLIRLLIAIRQV